MILQEISEPVTIIGKWYVTTTTFQEHLLITVVFQMSLDFCIIIACHYKHTYCHYAIDFGFQN